MRDASFFFQKQMREQPTFRDSKKSIEKKNYFRHSFSSRGLRQYAIVQR